MCKSKTALDCLGKRITNNEVKTMFDKIVNDIADTTEKLDSLAKKGLEREANMRKLETKFNEIEIKVENINDRIEKGFDGVNARFKELDNRFGDLMSYLEHLSNIPMQKRGFIEKVGTKAYLPFWICVGITLLILGAICGVDIEKFKGFISN